MPVIFDCVPTIFGPLMKDLEGIPAAVLSVVCASGSNSGQPDADQLAVLTAAVANLTSICQAAKVDSMVMDQVRAINEASAVADEGKAVYNKAAQAFKDQLMDLLTRLISCTLWNNTCLKVSLQNLNHQPEQDP